MSAMTPVSPFQAMKYQQFDTSGPVSVERFRKGADVREGVGGLSKIDSTFENTDYELLKSEYSQCGGDKA
mgnify:CR=1 FL=1